MWQQFSRRAKVTTEYGAQVIGGHTNDSGSGSALDGLENEQGPFLHRLLSQSAILQFIAQHPAMIGDMGFRILREFNSVGGVLNGR